MKVPMKTLGAGLLFVCLSFGKPATAEVSTAVPAQFGAIFSAVEGIINGGILNAGPVSFSGCFAPPSLGFLTVDFHFVKSATCNMSGDVVFGLIPLHASVNLDLYNVPMLEAVQFDVALSLSIKNKVTTTTMDISNGQLSVRPVANGPLDIWAITGHGSRQKTRGVGINGSMRINLFDEATLNGFAITRTVTQSGTGPKSKVVQVCNLAGADVQNYQTGTLTNCQ